MNASKISEFIRRYWRKKKNRRAVYSIALFAFVLVASGGYWYYQNKTVNVPPQFSEARSRAAEISERIAALTDESTNNLEKISDEDQAGNYERGLNLVLGEIDQNKRIREEAIKLSEELKIMASNLSEIRPKKAVEAGLQATTSGLELSQHLITYNDYTNQLLVLIQFRLEGNDSDALRARIEQQISRMNEEVKAVNELNKRYQEQMKDFDRLTKLGF